MNATGSSVLATRSFTLADQQAFAALSGDHNPIHLYELEARRTQAGAIVVHGVHGLLWALEQTARERPLAGLRKIDARFNRYIHLGQQAELRLTAKEGELRLTVLTDRDPATGVKLDWTETQPTKAFPAIPDVTPVPFGETPDVPSFEEMASLGGRCVQPDAERLAVAQFPALCAALGPSGVAAIAGASGVVGMKCPGLHSLFTQLTLRRAGSGPEAAGVGWRTTRTDPRARWVAVAVAGGGWEGEAICLARPAPVSNPSVAEIWPRVERSEFAGRTALIVGGSRGLGAVTAKLLAAGGARLRLTYARGREDAEAVAQDIRGACGSEACSIHACDVTGDVAGQLADVSAGISHLYYFATPRIARAKSRVYDRATLDEFLAVYVDGFSAVWDAVAASRPLAALYPSTVFLDERPKGMTEYVMAKAAAEMLCADLSRRQPDVFLSAPRIPRVLTDQTATSPPVPAEDPLEIMLPLLRSQPQW